MTIKTTTTETTTTETTTTVTEPDPRVVHRDEQPYVGLTETITMTSFGVIADRLPEIFGWLAAHDLVPAGPPFFRYLVIDMDADLVVEAGVPVAEPMTPDGALHGGLLPAGRYATTLHVGHPDGLLQVTADLLRWGEEQGLSWDSHPSEAGEVWGCRLESYRTDPEVEPDLELWHTELAFRLAD